MEVYRKIMAVRSTIVGITVMRRTRAGHILIEFDKEVAINEVTKKLKAVLSDRVEVSALVNRVTLRIKNVDPLTSKEELVEDIKRE